jgi:hypothetical protein
VIWEERLIFRPSSARRQWQRPIDLEVEDVWLEAAGERVHAWWCPGPDAAATVLYCHGTMGNLSTRVASLRQWHAFASVLVFDYPGYGKSSGRPTEAGCYAAGRAALDYLEQERLIPPEQVVVYGASLGGGVACELVHQRPEHALVLLAAFTSLVDVAHKVAPYLPIERLLRTRFDNLAKVGKHHGPLLVAHGTADHLVPFDHGKRLFAASPSLQKQFLPLTGVDHTESAIPAFYEGVREFLHSSLSMREDARVHPAVLSPASTG